MNKAAKLKFDGFLSVWHLHDVVSSFMAAKQSNQQAFGVFM